jgi:hypothetical protein
MLRMRRVLRADMLPLGPTQCVFDHRLQQNNMLDHAYVIELEHAGSFIRV